MKKEVKDTIITELGEMLKQFPHFYVVDVTGLDAEATSNLRRKAFEKQIKMVVVKNKLLIKAFEASDIDYSELYGSLKGNTALMFCDTANVPAKLLKEYKEGTPALKAAYAEESFYVGAENLDALCALKSKNELIAEVVAALEGPMQGVISALDGGTTIHGLLDAIEEKNA